MLKNIKMLKNVKMLILSINVENVEMLILSINVENIENFGENFKSFSEIICFLA